MRKILKSVGLCAVVAGGLMLAGQTTIPQTFINEAYAGGGDGGAGEIFDEYRYKRKQAKKQKALRAKKKRVGTYKGRKARKKKVVTKKDRDKWAKKRVEKIFAKREAKVHDRLRKKARRLLDPDTELESLRDVSITVTAGKGKYKKSRNWTMGGGGWQILIAKYARRHNVDTTDFVRRYLLIAAKTGNTLDETMTTWLEGNKDYITARQYERLTNLVTRAKRIRTYLDRWLEWKRAELARAESGVKTATMTEREAFLAQEEAGNALSEDDRKVIRRERFRWLYFEFMDREGYRKYREAKNDNKLEKTLHRSKPGETIQMIPGTR